MSKSNDWFSSLQRSDEVIKRLCGATSALSQLASRGCGQKVGLQKEATECTQKSRKKWRSENMSDWDR